MIVSSQICGLKWLLINVCNNRFSITSEMFWESRSTMPTLVALWPAILRFPPPGSPNPVIAACGFSGKSKWGLSNGGLGQSLQFAHNRLQLCTFVALWASFQGELSSQNDNNRRQSWTIVDKYLKPPLAKPPFRLSQGLRFREFRPPRPPQKEGRVGLAILTSQRVEARCDLNVRS